MPAAGAGRNLGRPIPAEGERTSNRAKKLKLGSTLQDSTLGKCPGQANPPHEAHVWVAPRAEGKGVGRVSLGLIRIIQTQRAHGHIRL